MDDDFWRDDAAAIRQRETEQRTGLRMPRPVAPGNASRDLHAVTRPARQAGPRTWRVIALASVVAVLCVCSWWTWHTWPVISLAEFDRLEFGMSIDQCRQIIGHDGSVYVSSQIPESLRQADIPFLTDTIGIEWNNPDDSEAAALFADGKLITKAHTGLE